MAAVSYNPVPQEVAQGGFIPETVPTVVSKGATAQALSNLGQTFQQAGDARAGLENELVANDANTDAMKQITDLYSQYQRNKGRSAQTALPEFQNSLDQIYDDTISKMPNLQAKTMLAQALRYTTRSYLGYARSHADSEFSSWLTTSATQATEEMGNQAILAVNNPQQMETFINGAADQTRKLYESQGWDTDVSEGKAKETKSGIISSVIQSVFATDPVRAQEMFNHYSPELTAKDHVALDGKFRIFSQDADADKLAGEIAVGGETTQLIKNEEGFRQDAYFDVNAYRTGFGSDTVTLPDGTIQKVTPDTKVTEADAERDLNRRVGEFTAHAASSVGQDIWNNLPDGARAGLVSLAYNHGSLPASVVAAAQTGDVNKIADAVAALPWNPARRAREANVIAGGTLVPKADAIEQALIRTNDNPEFRSKVLTYLNQRYAVQDARIADYNQQAALKAKQQKEASDNTESTILPYLFPDQSGKTPPKNLGSIIANNLDLDPSAKYRMLGVLNTNADGEPSTAQSASASTDLLRRMRLPEGDPNKVTGTGPIYDAIINKDIKRSDADWLIKQYNDMRDEGGTTLPDIQNRFFAGMKPLITKSNPMLGIIDPSGEEQFYNFQQNVIKQTAEYKKAGKNAFSLYDPTSPDYLGAPGALSPFQKTLTESAKDAASRMQGPQTWNTTVHTLNGPDLPPARPHAPDETPEQYLQNPSRAPSTTSDSVVESMGAQYRDNLVKMNKFTPEVIDDMTNKFKEMLKSKHGEIEPGVLNQFAFNDKLALLEHLVG